jgi:hypothetical protein
MPSYEHRGQAPSVGPQAHVNGAVVPIGRMGQAGQPMALPE